VAVRIWVREQATLQYWVGGWLDTWWHVCWVEGNLLDLGEVVFSILVQCELADFAERELVMGPHVGQVEDVDLLLLPKILSFLGGHGLELDTPFWEVTLLDSVEEVFLRVIGRVVGGIFLGNELRALLRLHVHLGVHPVTRLVHKLQCVSSVAVHEAVAIGDTAVTHQNHDLMDGLGILGQVVPEGSAVIAASEMCSRVTLLGVDEVRELGWVAEEKDWCVIGNHIPVALLSPELHGEASRVPSTIVRAGLPTNGREADCDWAFLSLLAEDIGET